MQDTKDRKRNKTRNKKRVHTFGPDTAHACLLGFLAHDEVVFPVFGRGAGAVCHGCVRWGGSGGLRGQEIGGGGGGAEREEEEGVHV